MESGTYGIWQNDYWIDTKETFNRMPMYPFAKFELNHFSTWGENSKETVTIILVKK